MISRRSLLFLVDARYGTVRILLLQNDGHLALELFVKLRAQVLIEIVGHFLNKLTRRCAQSARNDQLLIPRRLIFGKALAVVGHVLEASHEVNKPVTNPCKRTGEGLMFSFERDGGGHAAILDTIIKRILISG